MAVKTIERILESRRKMAERLEEGLAIAIDQQQPDKEVAIKELERLVARDTERLEAVRQTKAQAARRFDVEIDRREKRLAKLNRSLEDHRRAPVDPNRPVVPIAERELRPGLIAGLGSRSIDRLAQQRIVTIGDLARARPELIARILGATSERAKGFILGARDLIRG